MTTVSAPATTVAARRGVVVRVRDRPEAVTAEDIGGADRGLAEVEVPGCWTMQGFDSPHYTNVQMPFPGPPPGCPTPTRPACTAAPSPYRRSGHASGSCCTSAVRSRSSTCTSTAQPVGDGQGLPAAARVRSHRHRRAGPDLRARADRRAMVGRDLPRGPGPLVPRRAAPQRSFLYTTPLIHIADVHAAADFDPKPATGHLRVRGRVDGAGDGPPAGGPGRDRAARPVDGTGALRAPDQLGRQLLAVRGPRRRRVEIDRLPTCAVDRRNAGAARPHRHAVRRRGGDRGRRRRVRRRVPARRDPRPRAARERPAGVHQGREPPRSRSASRQGGDRASRSRPTSC